MTRPDQGALAQSTACVRQAGQPECLAPGAWRAADRLEASGLGVAQEIHMAYLEAGADILETNSFSGTVIAQARP